MAIYLLFTLLATLVAALAVASTRWLLRAVVRWRAIRRFDVSVEPATAAPGETLALRARVEPRGSNATFTVDATLRCTLFDHRPRTLLAARASLARDGDQFVGTLVVPRAAIRTGLVGDDLSSLFSEEARRWLVFWSVEFDVRAAGGRQRVVAQRVLPVDVPEGRALGPDPAIVRAIVEDTVATLKDDLVLNWLVKLAAQDGVIDPAERAFLRETLARAYGLADEKDADARIDAELSRAVAIDPNILRQHLSPAARLDLYRLLYAIAWRDGTLDAREHAFLVDSMRSLGLERADVAEVEREVVVAVAQTGMQ